MCFGKDKNMKALLAAVAISALPFAASAATYYIDVDSEGPYTSGFQTLSVGDELVLSLIHI